VAAPMKRATEENTKALKGQRARKEALL